MGSVFVLKNIMTKGIAIFSNTIILKDGDFIMAVIPER
jgi:hypothetical protein